LLLQLAVELPLHHFYRRALGQPLTIVTRLHAAHLMIFITDIVALGITTHETNFSRCVYLLGEHRHATRLVTAAALTGVLRFALLL
jgi:ribose/xylose/arabinose/galactoside ABC-type transport system permease subunit